MGRSLASASSPWAKEELKLGRKDAKLVAAKDARLKILSTEVKTQSISLNREKGMNDALPPIKNLIQKMDAAENAWKLSPKSGNLVSAKYQKKWEWLNFQQKAAKYVVALAAILETILNHRVDLWADLKEDQSLVEARK